MAITPMIRDNVIIAMVTESWEEAVGKAEEILDITTKWGEENKMTIEGGKMESLSLGKKEKAAHEYILHPDGRNKT